MELITDAMIDRCRQTLNEAAGTERRSRHDIEVLAVGNVLLAEVERLRGKGRPDSYFKDGDKAHVGDKEGVKTLVDEVHKRKIDLADEVFVVNVGGYIGDSTRSEVAYAVAQGKPIRWLEPHVKRQKLAAGSRPE